MKRLNTIRIVLLAALLAPIHATPSWADLKVFACEPEWAALAQEIGGDKVSTYSATTALQDPHQVQARPSLVARLRGADLLICTGAELEIGWLPVLLLQAANGAVQAGSPGYLEAAAMVQRLEIPSQVDRAQGDVHASGNPHIQTDPRRMAPVAREVLARMSQLDPANTAFYQKRHEAFAQKWEQALKRWESAAAPLRGVPVLVYHRSWIYLIDWLGIQQVGELEPKPGIPPSTAHLNDLINRLKANPAKMVIRSAYEDDRAAIFISEREKIPAVVLPFTVGGTDGAKDLFSLYDDTINRLLGALK